MDGGGETLLILMREDRRMSNGHNPKSEGSTELSSRDVRT